MGIFLYICVIFYGKNESHYMIMLYQNLCHKEAWYTGTELYIYIYIYIYIYDSDIFEQ